MEFEAMINELKEKQVGDILEYEPMYKHTTYKVGGPVRAFIEVFNIEKLMVLMAMIKENNIPYYIIGKGSNVLFGDKEFDGVIISLNKYFNEIIVDEHLITAGSGTSVIKLANAAANHGLTGLEFISGIPGTVGGVVYMNAGAYLSEVSFVLKDVTLLMDGEVRVLTKDEMAFGYRHSILQQHEDWVVLSARFELEKGNKEEIKELMKNRKAKRVSTQPWDRPSAGSVFRNLEEGPAWKYIDECGLRGYSIGCARFSKKHSNFIINTSYASAQDIKSLIEYAKKCVYEKFGVELHTEVRFMNW